MRKKRAPQTVSTSRFALTVAMSRKVAKRISVGGEVFHYGSIVLTGWCFTRIILMIVKWFNNKLYDALLFIAIALLCFCTAWVVAQLCFVFIWRGTSGYHERRDHRVIRGYVHKGTSMIDLSKEIIFGIWYHFDNGASVLAFLTVVVTNTGGLMLVLRADNWIASLAICFVIGIIVMFAAIALPITAGQIEDHANELEDTEKRSKKYWNMQEIMQLDPPQVEGQNNQQLPSGNTITGQFTEYDDDAVDMEALDDIPNTKPKKRPEPEEEV